MANTALPVSSTYRGWYYDKQATGGVASAARLHAVFNGTSIIDVDANDINFAQNVVAAGTLTSSGAFTASVNATFSSTITAGSDGVGADGEQLTSGGAGAECDWAAAACLREFKNVQDERTDAQDVLRQLVSTRVYDFKYKSKAESSGHIMSTGDVETTYTGIMADEAPWATHYKGRILNPINTFGYTVLALKALNERLEALEAA